jgi:hypothetical protein
VVVQARCRQQIFRLALLIHKRPEYVVTSPLRCEHPANVIPFREALAVECICLACKVPYDLVGSRNQVHGPRNLPPRRSQSYMESTFESQARPGSPLMQHRELLFHV